MSAASALAANQTNDSARSSIVTKIVNVDVDSFCHLELDLVLGERLDLVGTRKSRLPTISERYRPSHIPERHHARAVKRRGDIGKHLSEIDGETHVMGQHASRRRFLNRDAASAGR